MKKLLKNKNIIIVGSILIVLAIVIGGVLCWSNNKSSQQENNNTTSGVNENVLVPEAPAKDTESLTKNIEKATGVTLLEDEITFSEKTDIEVGEKVAVWVYSTPKFLGYFEVIIEDGVKKIAGLSEALSKISVEEGNHNLALATEEGKSLGYLDVFIENNKLLEEDVKEDAEEDKTNSENKLDNKKEENKTTVKEVIEEKEINFETTTQKEVNMLRGKKEIIQPGQKGIKKITYKVTYDANGKEISREKVSEKVTKEAVNQIEKVGTSDFNINTDTTRGSMFGMACPEAKTYTAHYDELLHCDDETYTNLESFGATIMSGKIIVTSVGGIKLSTAIIATPVNDYVYVGTYNGQKYYFDNRMGDGEPGTLTLEFCNQYGLSCGAW